MAMDNRYEFAGVYLTLPYGWVDVTDSLPAGTPPTLSDGKAGRGALQVSSAKYVGGTRPKVDRYMLQSFLRDFEDGQQFPAGASLHEFGSDFRNVFGVCVDHVRADDLIRVWYVSDGVDVALVTFIIGLSDLKLLPQESYEADGIVRSIGFES